MPLVNREINLILTWSENYYISSATEKITDTKLCTPTITLSTQDNATIATIEIMS